MDMNFSFSFPFRSTRSFFFCLYFFACVIVRYQSGFCVHVSGETFNRYPGCPFIQRYSFFWHNPLADSLAQKCNGGTSMAFLQICRRHRILFEGASASVKLLLTRKGFQSCRILHSHESKHLRVGKKDYSFPCVKKFAPGSREMFLVLIKDNQEVMKIKNNNNQ